MENLLVREPQFNAGHGNIPNKISGRLIAQLHEEESSQEHRQRLDLFLYT
ncbi:hypothetical protein [Paenibacillus glucanolyticus]|nr:hypothetical protein [Paenibacillus glucanolyticus]